MQREEMHVDQQVSANGHPLRPAAGGSRGVTRGGLKRGRFPLATKARKMAGLAGAQQGAFTGPL